MFHLGIKPYLTLNIILASPFFFIIKLLIYFYTFFLLSLHLLPTFQSLLFSFLLQLCSKLSLVALPFFIRQNLPPTNQKDHQTSNFVPFLTYQSLLSFKTKNLANFDKYSSLSTPTTTERFQPQSSVMCFHV